MGVARRDCRMAEINYVGSNILEVLHDIITLFVILLLQKGVQAILQRFTGPINILLTGKTGVGKSPLINAIIGKDIAKEGKDLQGVTRDVNGFNTERNGVKFNIWDSSGLQDITEDECCNYRSNKMRCLS